VWAYNKARTNMKHYPVRIRTPRDCERCHNEIKRGERCYYYTTCWKGISKKAYCHKGCRKK